MINLVGLWLVLYAVLVGWGLCVQAGLRRWGAFAGALSVGQTAWLGYATLVCFLQLASFVIPIRDVALAISLVPAVAGFVLQRKAVARHVHGLRAHPRRSLTLAILLLTFAATVAYASWYRPRLYDTGLYHFQAVNWFASYPVVPGLANLHTRFGYNNSVFLFDAFTDAFWQREAVDLANGFLIVAFLGHWATEILGARGPRRRLRQTYCLLTLPFIVGKLWSVEIPSLSTDLPMGVLSVVFFLELLSLPAGSRDRVRMHLVLLLCLGAVITTTKLSGLPFFAVASVVVLVIDRRDIDRRTRCLMFAIPALLVSGWLVRGVILSGWLLYPGFGRLPLPWSVPRSVAKDDLDSIRSWSRLFGQPPSEVFGHGFWYWFGPWLEKARETREFVVAIASATLLAWRFYGGAPSSLPRRAGERAAIAAVALAGAQWFWTAPEIRYGAHLFWIAAAILLAPILATSMRTKAVRALLLLFTLVVTYWADGFTVHKHMDELKWWGRPPVPPPARTQEVSPSPDTKTLYPQETDQCWNAPIPCSPQAYEAILREPGDLSSGYLRKSHEP